MLLATEISLAQTYLEYVVESTQNSDLIIEGRVDSTEGFRSEKGGVFTRSYISVRGVLKGEWNPSVPVVVETFGGSVEGFEQICPHCTKLHVDEQGVFFLKKEGAHYVLLNGNAGKIRQLNISRTKQGVIPSLRIYVPDWEMLLSGVKKAAKGGVLAVEDLEPTDTEICLKIDSITLVDERHISAKVYAKANIPDLLFGGAELSIKYSTSVLGAYVVQSNVLSVFPGDFVADSTVYSLASLDLAADEFEFSIGSECSSNLAYAVLGTDYEEIARLILEVDIDELDMLLNGTEITNADATYFDQASSSGCSSFRRICLDGEFLPVACSITAVEIDGEPGAGIGSIAKIMGEGFKEEPGKVKIPDADIDLAEGIVLDELGATLLSWSDNLIEVKITGLKDDLQQIMGSGNWKVSPTGIFNSCTQQVEIEFAAQQILVKETDGNGNTIEDVPKDVRRYSLMSLDGALTYYLDNTIDENPALTSQGLSFSAVEMLVEEALCEWESKIGVSMNYMGGIDPAQYINEDDGLNVIYFTNNLEGPPTLLALTILNPPKTCNVIIDDDDYYTYPAVFDTYTGVKESINWYDKNSGQSIGEGEIDLYTLLLHEIGHSLGLHHALAPEQGAGDSRIMYYSFFAGDDSKHHIDDGDEFGGKYLAEESRDLLDTTVTTYCQNNYKLEDDIFCSLDAVSEVEANDVFFSIKPTVAEANAQISITNEANGQVAFVVVDALGHRVAFFDLMRRDTYFLELTNSGIYFVCAFYEGRYLSKKIIVQ